METTSPQPGPPQGYFQCTDCKKTYSRVDHLARHVRSHMQEKPFECKVCSKKFGRPDLLKRHALNHDGEDPAAKRQKRLASQSSRVSQACKACASSKLKCGEEKPCARCLQRKIPCVYPSTANDRGKSEPQHSPGITSSPDTTMIEQVQSPALLMPGDESYLSEFLRGVLMPQQDEFGMGPATDWSENPYQSSHDVLDFAGGTMDFSPDGYSFVDMFNNQQSFSFGLSEPRPTSASMDRNFMLQNGLEIGSMGLVDHNMALPTGIETGSVGLSNHDLPSQIGTASDFVGLGSSHPISQYAPQAGSITPKQRAGLAVEAFKAWSFSRWSPTIKDNGFTEQSHLSLQDGDSPDAHGKASPRISTPLSHATRDRVFNLAINLSKLSQMSPSVTSFPSTSICDDLFQGFLYYHNKMLDNWIHVPTVQVNHQIPELTCCMMATAAIWTGIKPIQKLGYALQEVARLTVPLRCEENNATVRQLGLVQGMMLIMDIGAWSGSGRKLEIAESFNHVHITLPYAHATQMLRRGGQFVRSKAPPIQPLPEDSGDVLDTKWREWAERESFKRLALHAIIADAQTSIALLHAPTVSYAELTLSLPASDDLWAARTAEDWKTAALKSSDQPLEGAHFVDCVSDPSHLTANQAVHNLQISGLVVLHQYWAMVWEYTQMSSLQKRHRRRQRNGGGLLLNSRLQDLLNLLNLFRMSLSEWHTEPKPELSLILDLLYLYLHVSLEDIQLFAGKDGQEEAKRVLPSLLEWYDSTAARHAMFYAGQVLRAARNMPSQQIRDFYIIAVYHAGLALWVFGIISQTRTPQRTDDRANKNKNLQVEVALDGPSSTNIERYIALGRGRPVITSSPTTQNSDFVSLEEPDQVVQVLVDLVRDNCHLETREEAPPPLVANVMQLMRDLEKAAATMNR